MYFSAPDEEIWIGVLRLELKFPHSRSLKDKRKQLARLRDRFRTRSNLSVAEVGHLENKQLSVMVLSIVGNDGRVLQSYLDKTANLIHSIVDGLIQSQNVKIFPYSPEFL